MVVRAGSVLPQKPEDDNDDACVSRSKERSWQKTSCVSQLEESPYFVVADDDRRIRSSRCFLEQQQRGEDHGGGRSKKIAS
jgi:hypothetical protein